MPMVRVRREQKPLTADRARRQARTAKAFHERLPHDHPYARLPVWVPFFIARRLAPLIARKSSAFALH